MKEYNLMVVVYELLMWGWVRMINLYTRMGGLQEAGEVSIHMYECMEAHGITLTGGEAVTCRQRRIAENLGVVDDSVLIWSVATPDDEYDGMTMEEFEKREMDEKEAV